MTQRIVSMRNQSRCYFHRQHMKIVLGNFDEKLGRQNIFKMTIGKESLHDGSNDNGVKIVNFGMLSF